MARHPTSAFAEEHASQQDFAGKHEGDKVYAKGVNDDARSSPVDGALPFDERKLERKILLKMDLRYAYCAFPAGSAGDPSKAPGDISVDTVLTSIITMVCPRFSILPVLALLFLFSFLDRTNM